MNAKQLTRRTMAIGLAGTMALVAPVPALAAPVPSSTVIVKTTAPGVLDEVRARRGRAIGAGVVLGVIGAMAGAAAAQNQYYGPGYYAGPGYYGGPGYYEAPGYYVGPGYYEAPGYYVGPGYYGPSYDPGAAIALGMIGAAAGAIAATPY